MSRRTLGGWASAALGALLLAMPAPALAAFPPASSWQTNGTVRTITFANGIMYIGGEFTSVRPPGTPVNAGFDVPRNNVAAFSESTGDLVTGWDPNVNGRVYSLAVSSSTVYIGGLFSTVGGVARANAAAVDATTGALLPWLATTGAAVNVITVGPNGNIFIGGEFAKVLGHNRPHIAELTQAGALVAWAPQIGQVTGFPCPPRCNPTVFSIGFSSDGLDVYFGGHFGLVNGIARNEAAEVPVASASTTMAFDPNIYAPANCPTCHTVETSRVYQIIPTATRVYTCGGYWKVNGATQSYNVSAFNPTTGKLDTGFTGQDDGDTPGCLLRAGVLYVGGHFNVAAPGCQPSALSKCVTRHHVAAFNATDGSLLSWNPTANSNHGLLAIAGDASYVGFGGYFTKFGGVATQGIALYSTLPPP